MHPQILTSLNLVATVCVIYSGLLVFCPKCLYSFFLQVKPQFSPRSHLGSVSVNEQELDCVPEGLQHRARLGGHRLGKCSNRFCSSVPTSTVGKSLKCLCEMSAKQNGFLGNPSAWISCKMGGEITAQRTTQQVIWLKVTEFSKSLLNHHLLKGWLVPSHLDDKVVYQNGMSFEIVWLTWA